jgi:hypothetical protein
MKALPIVYYTGRNKMIANLYRRRNYKICKAIDLTKLGTILNEMIESGDLSRDKAKAFDDMASGLLKIIRLENNKLLKEEQI